MKARCGQDFRYEINCFGKEAEMTETLRGVWATIATSGWGSLIVFLCGLSMGLLVMFARTDPVATVLTSGVLLVIAVPLITIQDGLLQRFTFDTEEEHDE